MQDLETLEGKTIVELREIAKSLGIVPSTMKKQELFEKIVAFATGAMAQSDVPAEPQQEVEPQEAPRRGRRPRMASVKVSETSSKANDNIDNSTDTPFSVTVQIEPIAEIAVEPTAEPAQEQAPAPAKRRGRKPKAAVVEESVEAVEEVNDEPQNFEQPAEFATEESAEESEGDDDGEFYDEEYDEHYCSVNLDEDEMEKYVSGQMDYCRYFTPYDEYKVVQKQN